LRRQVDSQHNARVTRREEVWPRRIGVGFVLTLGALALALACRKETDPIRLLLDDLTEAAEDRDAEAVLERLAPDFQGQNGLRRVDAGAELKRYFFAYEKIDVTLADVAVEPAGDVTRVRLRAELSGKPKDIGGLQGLLPALSAYRFELDVKPGGKAWVVTRASWERLDVPPAP
jgi:hypothetical protein